MSDGILREITDSIVRVHLENPEAIKIQRTEEKEPEHFQFSTVVVAYNTPGYNNYEPVLPLDPLRKDWSILAVDGPVVVCNKAQVNDKANQVAGVPFPQGGYLAQGGSITGTGTAEAFVVATSATPVRVSVFVNRRGS
jgi:hypothetical protein